MKRRLSNAPQISLIADFDGDIRSLFDITIGDSLPILPLRNMVLFPGVVIPVVVERPFSVEVINKAKKTDCYIGVVCQDDPSVEEPKQSDFYPIGTVAKVVRTIEMPDKKLTVLLQGYCRFKLGNIWSTSPYYEADVTQLQEIICEENDREMLAIVDTCKEMTDKLFHLNDPESDANFAVKNIRNATFLINFIASNIVIPTKEKIEMLWIDDIKNRAYALLKILQRETQFAMLKAEIQHRTREELDRQQKEYFLQQQIRNIQDELGESPADQDIFDLEEKAAKKKMPAEVCEVFDKELKKLERINLQSPDYNVQLSYLQTILGLPWEHYTKDNLSLENAKKVLDADHYGLEKVKERILEYLAVINLKHDMKSPILCLYGPPGVGKTSLGKSIAKSLKRKYVRVSLGGLHDESEIRGHRRTYIGAMPGRIIKSLMKCGSGNPVFVLDEIDKVSSNGFNGDPSSALLEVLDPEQNVAFHDNYLDIDYDLSKVLFIATANNIGNIPAPLRDRMEMIEVSGYITEEKIEIAKHYLVPKGKENTGLKPLRHLKFSDTALEQIIEQYTRESGVRQLDKTLNKALRKLACQYVDKGKLDYNTILPKHLVSLLGQPPFIRDKYLGNDYAGVVTGLAWTSVGGEILFIETSLSKGKSNKLTLTGNLGDVMKESAVLALEYVKAHASEYNIDSRIFDNWNIHIHVPEGATPKDGPSAGITIATSIVSALTQRKVRNQTAMTGEITLRGKVLPVGGIKEKILAAKRAGITSVILSKENQKDIEEIDAKYLNGVHFDFVENVEDVLKLALLKEKVANPLEFKIEEETKDQAK